MKAGTFRCSLNKYGKTKRSPVCTPTIDRNVEVASTAEPLKQNVRTQCDRSASRSAAPMNRRPPSIRWMCRCSAPGKYPRTCVLRCALGPDAHRLLGNAESTSAHSLMSCPIYRKYEFGDLERRSGHLPPVTAFRNLLCPFYFILTRTRQTDKSYTPPVCSQTSK